VILSVKGSEGSTSSPARSTVAESKTVAPQPTRVHTVLVVDDERSVRDSLRVTLEQYFRVLTADRGTVALRILEREPVSVMTLDLRMPGWSGPETLLEVREVNSDVEVVIVTAYSSYTEAMRAIRLSAFDMVSKPFEIEHLLDTVRRAAVRYENRERARGGYEALDGLTDRLIGSIHGLSATELQKLAQGKQAELGELRERAHDVLVGLYDIPSRVKRADFPLAALASDRAA
jgi:DNA-binding NtrC family response regulator